MICHPWTSKRKITCVWWCWILEGVIVMWQWMTSLRHLRWTEYSLIPVSVSGLIGRLIIIQITPDSNSFPLVLLYIIRFKKYQPCCKYWNIHIKITGQKFNCIDLIFLGSTHKILTMLCCNATLTQIGFEHKTHPAIMQSVLNPQKQRQALSMLVHLPPLLIASLLQCLCSGPLRSLKRWVVLIYWETE